MSQILYTKEIGEKIRSLIHTALVSSLGLKSVNLGDISFYESAAELNSVIPGVFVKPQPGADIKIRTTDLRYTVTYTYRIVFVKTFAVADLVLEDKIDATNAITEVILNNNRLSGLTLTNAQVERMTPTNVEYEPIEDGFVFALSANLVASAVTVQVITHTSTS